MSVTNILIPLDGSTHAEHAVSVGLSTARSLGARVELLGVDDLNPLVESFMAGSEHHKDWLSTYFEGLTEAIRAVSSVPVVSTTAAGRADEVITTHAERVQADLVVMASDGRNGIMDAFRGSHSEQIVRLVPCPLLVVPITAHEMPLLLT